MGTSLAAAGSPVRVDWRSLVVTSLRLTWWVWLFPAGLVAALAFRSLFALDFVHVMSAILWTGTDLFMGFVIGPVMRRLDVASRKNVINLLLPRTLFYMPVIAATTTTAGWYLAQWEGVFRDPTLRPWFIAALTLALLMFIQGVGLLLPMNLRVFSLIQQPRPDVDRIRRTMVSFMGLVAWQGILQLGIVFVMVHFVI